MAKFSLRTTFDCRVLMHLYGDPLLLARGVVALRPDVDVLVVAREQPHLGLFGGPARRPWLCLGEATHRLNEAIRLVIRACRRSSPAQ